MNGAGRLYSFEGFYAPASVGFHYVSWWDQARRAWMWWAAGILAFFAFGWIRPWRKLLWGALVLTFLPLWTGQSLTGCCNALLAGWIVAFLIYQTRDAAGLSLSGSLRWKRYEKKDVTLFDVLYGARGVCNQRGWQE